MALIRWEPFRDANLWEPMRSTEILRREMDRLLDQFSPQGGDGHRNNLAFIPAAELTETPEALELRVELPGLKPEHLDIQVAENAVSLRGERRSETRTEEQGTVRSEFRYGRFERIIPLPALVNNTQAKAEFKDGILILTLPRSEADKNKIVKLTVNS